MAEKRRMSDDARLFFVVGFLLGGGLVGVGIQLLEAFTGG